MGSSPESLRRDYHDKASFFGGIQQIQICEASKILGKRSAAASRGNINDMCSEKTALGMTYSGFEVAPAAQDPKYEGLDPPEASTMRS